MFGMKGEGPLQGTMQAQKGWEDPEDPEPMGTKIITVFFYSYVGLCHNVHYNLFR